MEKISISDYQNVEVIGLHAFQWGNLNDINQIENIWDQTCNKLINFANEMKIDLQILDLGGGIGLTYELNKRPIEFKHVNNLLNSLRKKYNLKKFGLNLVDMPLVSVVII